MSARLAGVDSRAGDLVRAASLGSTEPDDYCESLLGDEGMAGWAAVRGDAAPVGEYLAGVLETDNPVAEQTPALFREAGDDFGGVPVGGVGRGAGGLVLAHRGSPEGGGTVSCFTRPVTHSTKFTRPASSGCARAAWKIH